MFGHMQRLFRCIQRAHLRISNQWPLHLKESIRWQTFNNALGSGIIDLGLSHIWFQHFVKDIHFSLGKITGQHLDTHSGVPMSVCNMSHPYSNQNWLWELTPMEIHWSSEDPAGNFTITFEPVFSSVVFSGRILRQSRIRTFSVCAQN